MAFRLQVIDLIQLFLEKYLKKKKSHRVKAAFFLLQQY